MMSNVSKIMSLTMTEGTMTERQPEIVFGDTGRPVPLLIVRKARVRRMNLRIDTAKAVVRLTLPRFAPLGPALRWVEEKRGWVEAQLGRLPEGSPIRSGSTVPFGDQTLTLDWAPTHSRMPKVVGDRLMVGGPEPGLAERVMRWLRKEALARLASETRLAAARAGVSVERVGVGDPASRWGSCSASGAIRYSWRLILAPDFVLRATVAHEVAHRIHMNHSPAFHAKVAEIFGEDPKPARLWLRRNGPELHGFGRG